MRDYRARIRRIGAYAYRSSSPRLLSFLSRAIFPVNEKHARFAISFRAEGQRVRAFARANGDERGEEDERWPRDEEEWRGRGGEGERRSNFSVPTPWRGGLVSSSRRGDSRGTRRRFPSAHSTALPSFPVPLRLLFMRKMRACTRACTRALTRDFNSVISGGGGRRISSTRAG